MKQKRDRGDKYTTKCGFEDQKTTALRFQDQTNATSTKTLQHQEAEKTNP